jgi:uncharacterized LabA/DUF88 family protein
MEYGNAITVRLGEMVDGGDAVQKEVDNLLTIDMVLLSQKRAMKTAILVASDGDYVPAIEFAKDEGVTVILYYFRDDNTSHKLRRKADCDVKIPVDIVKASGMARPQG